MFRAAASVHATNPPPDDEPLVVYQTPEGLRPASQCPISQALIAGFWRSRSDEYAATRPLDLQIPKVIVFVFNAIQFRSTDVPLSLIHICATHTFNAMRSLDHREPGILGVALAEDSIYAELICDGIHTTPEMVKIWSRSKGPHRAILVTDAMSAAGMPDGDYRLGGLTVTVANGRATSGEVLAGSVLTLDRALANFLRFTNSSLEHGLRLLTTNPAALIGLPGLSGLSGLPAAPGLATSTAGHLAPDLPANFVAVNPDGTLAASILHGQPAC